MVANGLHIGANGHAARNQSGLTLFHRYEIMGIAPEGWMANEEGGIRICFKVEQQPLQKRAEPKSQTSRIKNISYVQQCCFTTQGS